MRVLALVGPAFALNLKQQALFGGSMDGGCDPAQGVASTDKTACCPKADCDGKCNDDEKWCLETEGNTHKPQCCPSTFLGTGPNSRANRPCESTSAPCAPNEKYQAYAKDPMGGGFNPDSIKNVKIHAKDDCNKAVDCEQKKQRIVMSFSKHFTSGSCVPGKSEPRPGQVCVLSKECLAEPTCVGVVIKHNKLDGSYESMCKLLEADHVKFESGESEELTLIKVKDLATNDFAQGIKIVNDKMMGKSFLQTMSIEDDVDNVLFCPGGER